MRRPSVLSSSWLQLMSQAILNSLVGLATDYFYAMSSRSLPRASPSLGRHFEPCNIICCCSCVSVLILCSYTSLNLIPIRHFYHVIRMAAGSGSRLTVYSVHGLRVKVRVWSYFEAIWPRETTTSTPSTDHCLFPE